MAITEKNITVGGTFKLKIGETEIALTREEADRLYGELYKALGKQNYTYTPVIPYIEPVHRWWEYKPYEVTYKATCSSGTGGGGASSNCTSYILKESDRGKTWDYC